MNLEKALKHVKRCSYVSRIEKIPNRGPKQARWMVETHNTYRHEYTDREIIKYARQWLRPQPKVKSLTKFYGNRSNRHKTRQKIQEQRFHEIPQGRPVDRGNSWDWD